MLCLQLFVKQGKWSYFFEKLHLIKSKLEFNIYIDFINGNFVSIVTGAFLNLAVLNHETKGEAIASAFSVLMTIGIFLYMGYTLYWINKNKHNEEKLEKLSHKYGELYDGLKRNGSSNKICLMYY